MKRVRRAVPWALLLLVNAVWGSEYQIDWRLSPDSEIIDTAREIGRRAAQPGETTHMLLTTDIQVDAASVRKRVRSIWYYRTSEDVESYGSEVIGFDKNDALTIYTAATISAAGKLHLFDPATLKVVDSGSYNTFTDRKDAVLALPGLDAGSLSVLDYEIVLDRKRLESDWSAIAFPQVGFPRESFSFSVTWQPPETLYWSSSSDVVTCEQTRNSLECRGSNVPAAKRDPNVLWADVLGQIVIGERLSWDQVVANSREAFDSALGDTDGAETLVAAVSSGGGSTADSIARFHEFVAKEIRYVSMSEQGHAITPHAVASTLKNRYGDCKDKSAVLFDLLRRAGLAPYPVLVATKRGDVSALQTPTMKYFDHMVVCFDYNGKRYCLDATDSSTNWRYLSNWIQGMVSLPLKRGARPTTLGKERFRWKLAVRSQVSFTEDGGQIERLDRTYRGEYAGSVRNILAGKSDPERNDWAKKNYQNTTGSSVEPEVTFQGVETMAPALVVSSTARYEPFLNRDEDLHYVEYDYWLRDEISSLLLKNEHFDNQFPGVRIDSDYVFDIGERWRLTAVTAELDLQDDFGSMRRTVSRDPDGKLRVRTEMSVPARHVEQTKSERFNKFLQLLSRESTMQFSGKLK